MEQSPLSLCFYHFRIFTTRIQKTIHSSLPFVIHRFTVSALCALEDRPSLQSLSNISIATLWQFRLSNCHLCSFRNV